MRPFRFTRRNCLAILAGSGALLFSQQSPPSDAPKDWVCPMDPDVRSSTPTKCPRCGMQMVLGVPERKEYSLEITTSPEVPTPGARLRLTLRVLDPVSGALVHSFEVVHEKLIHFFLVSENLEFFAHLHPAAQPDGTFVLDTQLPLPGMYRMLADFYPSGAVPQLSAATLFVAGHSASAHLAPALAPCRSNNLTAALQLDPEQPLAGMESRLIFHLDPMTNLQPYLGAWGHMLAVSADLVDILHLHPFLANGKGPLQFNIIFPRSGLYRIWTQFQRENQVNTTVFTVPVRQL